MMEKYLIFLLLMTATTHDKQAIKPMWKVVFKDNIEINVSALGKERLVTNTNKVYWRLVVSTQQLKNMGVDLSNVTKAKFETWKNVNLDNPGHFQIVVGDDWRAVLTTNGFEAVPYPNPLP